MAISIPDFFRFAADNVDLLEEIYETEEIDDAALAYNIARFRRPNSPSAETIKRQLFTLGILESTAESETRYEMLSYLRDVFDWLLKRQQILGGHVLAAYLSELIDSVDALSEQRKAKNAAAVRRILASVTDLIDRMRRFGTAHREAVTTEAQRLRAVTEPLSSTERFGVVSYIWERLLVHLRELIDTKGRFTSRLNSLEHLLSDAEETFRSDLVISRNLARAKAKLRRMQQTVLDAHHQSLIEISPLYERMRKESLWARGASTALMLARESGVASLKLEDRLGIVESRSQQQYGNDRLLARIAEITKYDDSETVTLPKRKPVAPLEIISRNELVRALRAAAPIDDVLTFILERWPNLPTKELLRLYLSVRMGRLGKIELYRGDSKDYHLPRLTIQACPISLRAPR